MASFLVAVQVFNKYAALWTDHLHFKANLPRCKCHPKHQATKGTRTHIGPSFCCGFNDAKQLGRGDRAGGGGGHLGVPRGRGRLLRRYRHEGARLAEPGAERANAEGTRRRRVLGDILGEEGGGGGGGGGGGSEKIPCHWSTEKGFDTLMPSLAFQSSLLYELYWSVLI